MANDFSALIVTRPVFTGGSFKKIEMNIEKLKKLAAENAIDIVMSRGFRWVLSEPGKFDAAEWLHENYLQEMPKRVFERVEEILLRSGRYEKINVQL